MKQFTPNLITAALIAGGLTLGVAPAMAQQTDKNTDQQKQTTKKKKASDLEVIKVSGIRASLQRAQALKMDNSSIVEVISAEDIGKLPDSSIAESIARLPGLAAQRLDGRASSVAIRGMGENFSTATLNGREQVSIGDNRGVEFDVYPSEIMSSVTVYKTPDASLMSQGIGGTIDLHTIRPLSVGKRTVSISARMEKNGIGKLNPDADDKGWRSNLAYIDQFDDNKVGVAIAYAHMKSPNQEQHWNTWGYPTDADGNYVLGGAKPYARSSTLTRDTLMGVVQLRPNSDLDVTLDGMHINFSDDQILRGIEIPAAWGQGSVENVTVTDGFVTKGIIHDQRVVVRNDYKRRKADLTALGANAKYTLNDNWMLEGDLSYSHVNRQIWDLESYSGTGRGDTQGVADTIGYDLNAGNKGAMFTHGLDYSDRSLILMGGPLSWGGGMQNIPSAPSYGSNDGQDGFINLPDITDTLKTARGSAKYTFDSGALSSIEFGVNYTHREKVKHDEGVYLTLKQYPDMLPVPDKYYLGSTSLDFIGMGNMVAYNSFQFYKDGNYTETKQGLADTGRALNSWTVTEKVTTGYVKANIDDNWFGLPVTGNVGMQWVHTDQSSLGNQAGINDTTKLVEIQKVDIGDTYDEFLPSLNLSFEVADQQMVRVGLSRTLSRSRMDRMNSSFGYSFNKTQNVDKSSPWSASGGNPKLRPYIANQFDLTYENYFAEDGYFAAALFYKDLTNWQYNVPTIMDFSNVPAPETPITPLGVSTTWENTKGGYVEGAELTLSLPFRMISPVLDGFGANMSATFLNSQISFKAPTAVDVETKTATYGEFKEPVPGLSKHVYNATVYYEKNGFQARVSMRKRSDFLGEVAAISYTRQEVSVKGNSLIDAQISYDFSDSNIDYLKGLTITLQGQNLTDEPFITSYSSDPRQVRDYQVFGRNFLAGFNYKF